MKTNIWTLLAFALLLISTTTQAALPDGTVAPDWTLTDLDGNTHNLYSDLNSGKHVVIDFSATWCGPCWSYHSGGTLETLYDLYGPNGTDEIRVYFIEADASTNTSCLYGPTGCNSSTQGNWVASTGFPIMDPSGPETSVISNYQVSYFPTLYAISANNFKVYEVGQASQSVWESWLFNSFEMTGTADITNANCNEAEGLIDFTPENGYGNISYSWSNNSTSQDMDGIPWTYSVDMTDSHGYTQTMGPYEIGFDVVGNLGLEAQQVENVQCYNQGDGIISTLASGGDGDYSYAWSNGDNGATITNLDAGMYTVVVTDGYGCDQTETYEVTEPDDITNNFTQTNESCDSNNGTINIFSSGGTGNFLYNIGSGFTPTSTFSNLAEGNYQVSIIDANACFELLSIDIENIPAPTVQVFNVDDLNCCASNITLFSTGSTTGDDITYLWSTEDGNIEGDTDGESVDITAAGEYSLEVVNTTTGCSTTENITIEATAGFDIEGNSNGILTCDIDAVTLEAIIDLEENYTVAWYDNGNNLIEGENELTIDVMNPGQYSVIITSESTCCQSTEVFTVTQDANLPTVEIPANSALTCNTTMVQICQDDLGAGHTYQWEGPNGTQEGLCIDADVAGSYCLTITNTDSNCSSVDCTTISDDTMAPDFLISSNYDPVLRCDDNSLVLNNMNSTTDHTIQWFLNDGTDPIGEGNDLTVTEAGTYTVMILDTDSGCASSSEIEVNAPPAIEAVETVIHLTCNGADNGSIEVVANNQNEDFDILWNTTDETFTIDNLPAGYYSNVITDAYGCTEENNYLVTEPDDIIQTNVVITNDADGQSNGSIDLTVEGGTGTYTYTWTDDADPSNLPEGTYFCTVQDENGCSYEFGPFEVQNIVGIEVLLNDQLWDISPNPFNGFVKVYTDASHQQVNINIIDITGKIILSNQMMSNQNELILDTQSLESGVYILQINTKEGQKVVKMIKR